jgi:hypothetical protein
MGRENNRLMRRRGYIQEIFRLSMTLKSPTIQMAYLLLHREIVAN